MPSKDQFPSTVGRYLFKHPIKFLQYFNTLKLIIKLCSIKGSFINNFTQIWVLLTPFLTVMLLLLYLSGLNIWWVIFTTTYTYTTWSKGLNKFFYFNLLIIIQDLNKSKTSFFKNAHICQYVTPCGPRTISPEYLSKTFDFAAAWNKKSPHGLWGYYKGVSLFDITVN